VYKSTEKQDSKVYFSSKKKSKPHYYSLNHKIFICNFQTRLIMPIFEYCCSDCNSNFELLKKIAMKITYYVPNAIHQTIKSFFLLLVHHRSRQIILVEIVSVETALLMTHIQEDVQMEHVE